jgi:saccharopine dehydrogenase-like NADP-dependent oxidoreductase
MGLFDESGEPSPRAVLIAALDQTLPRGEPDLVLVRVWIEADETARVLEIEDVHDGRFSALARTTAFPATALIDLVVRGEVNQRGVHSMPSVVDGALLTEDLRSVGIVVVERF